MISCLELGRADHAEFAVEAAVVEPLDSLQGGELHVLQSPPGSTVADQLGLA